MADVLDAAGLAEVRALVDNIVGFEHRHYPDNIYGQNTLAEWGTDGKWRTWDMRAPYSTEACAFIAAAPDTIRRLLATVDALKAEVPQPESITTDHGVKQRGVWLHGELFIAAGDVGEMSRTIERLEADRDYWQQRYEALVRDVQRGNADPY